MIPLWLWRFSLGLVLLLFVTRILPADVALDNGGSLWAQYQKVRTIHCKATETADAPGSKSPAQHGTYEYWADGKMFKIADVWNAAERRGCANEVYWDGTQFQRRVVGGSYLGISAHLNPFLLVGVPPPLAPFQFLEPGGIEQGKQLTLDQIENNATASRLRLMHSLSADGAQAEYPAPPYDYTNVPGISRKFDSVYRIRFGGKPGYLPIEIRRIVQSGAVWDRWEIGYMSVHTDAGDVYLPSEIKNTTVAPFATDPAVRVGIFDFKVTELDVNLPISRDIFTCDFKLVANVVDMDHEQELAKARAAATTAPVAPSIRTRAADH
jgi:hypothetical protein